MAKVGISKSPASYVSRLSKGSAESESGKAGKSNKKKNGLRTASENAGEQVSLVSPLRSAHQKKEKLRVFSKVRLALDIDFSEVNKHARMPSADLEKLVPKNGLKNALSKPVSLKSKSIWGRIKNFLRKNESPVSESFRLASRSGPQSTPPKNVVFGENEDISYVIGKPPATRSLEHPQSETTKAVNVSKSVGISMPRQTDKSGSDPDARNIEPFVGKSSLNDDMNRLRQALKKEVDELDKFLAEFESDAPNATKPQTLQQDLHALAQEVERNLDGWKELAPESASQASDARSLQQDLHALAQQVERDLAGWKKHAPESAAQASDGRKLMRIHEELRALQQELDRDLKGGRVNDDTDESRLRLKQEEEELDKILADYKSGATTMSISKTILEDLKALAHEQEQDLENWIKLAPESAGQESDGHKFARIHEQLDALLHELEQDREGGPALASQPASGKSVESKHGATDVLELQSKQKLDMDLRNARNFEEIERLIAEAEEKLRADGAGQSEISKPGAVDK